MRKILLALLALFPAFAFAQTGGGFPPPQNPKICPTSGGCTVTLKLGQQAILVKGANTSRNTTSTLTVDPDMQLVCTNCNSAYLTGTIIYNITTAAQGFKAQLMANNTCSSFLSNNYATGQTTGLFAGQDWTANSFINTSGTGTFFFYTEGVQQTAPINYFLCWSQGVSGATNTFLTQGTTWILTRTQ